MLVSAHVNLFNNTFKVLFPFIIIPCCKVEDCTLTDLFLLGCFKQVFSYKGVYNIWRTALSQQPQDAVIDPH